MDCSPPGSVVHGILQARILEWVSTPYSRVSSQSRDQTCISYISCIGRQVLYYFSPPGKPLTSVTSVISCQKCINSIESWKNTRQPQSEVAQSCLTLCDPMNRNLPGASVHGIFQARVLEWVAICFSRGSSQPRDQTQVSRERSQTNPNWESFTKELASTLQKQSRLWRLLPPQKKEPWETLID